MAITLIIVVLLYILAVYGILALRKWKKATEPQLDDTIKMIPKNFQLREEVFQFLQENGYAPKETEDGYILFLYKGYNLHIRLEEKNNFVLIGAHWAGMESLDRALLLECINATSVAMKYSKAYLLENNSIRILIPFDCFSEEEFKAVFIKYLDSIFETYGSIINLYHKFNENDKLIISNHLKDKPNNTESSN